MELIMTCEAISQYLRNQFDVHACEIDLELAPCRSLQLPQRVIHLLTRGCAVLDDLHADPKERVVCRLQAGASACGFRQKETSLTYLLQACGLAQPMVIPGNVGRRTAPSHESPEPADNCVCASPTSTHPNSIGGVLRSYTTW